MWTDLLGELLPGDLPHRDRVMEISARHLAMIVETNETMNLTRITSPREAVVKHILDSLLPCKAFAGARSVMDAGTGAGFPGIPLSVIFPEMRFLLVESVQKKARFVQAVVDALQLKNVEVSSQRAEELLRSRKLDIVTARALAPIERAIGYFAPAFKTGARALLYKGPDVEAEMGAAAMEARKRRVTLRIVDRYELPEQMGGRSMVEISG